MIVWYWNWNKTNMKTWITYSMSLAPLQNTTLRKNIYNALTSLVKKLTNLMEITNVFKCKYGLGTVFTLQFSVEWEEEYFLPYSRVL